MTKLLRMAALAGVLGLAACSGDELTRTFGLTRDAPDEFQVTTRAPLSMPPDFSLRPPQPGAQRPQEMTQQQQAEAALVPDTVMMGAQSGPTSAGQQALVQEAGPAAPRDIRARVNSEFGARHAEPELCRPADVLAAGAASGHGGRPGAGEPAAAAERGARAVERERGHADHPAAAARHLQHLLRMGRPSGCPIDCPRSRRRTTTQSSARRPRRFGRCAATTCSGRSRR